MKRDKIPTAEINARVKTLANYFMDCADMAISSKKRDLIENARVHTERYNALMFAAHQLLSQFSDYKEA